MALSTVGRKRPGDYEDIGYETAEGIAEITINHPERRDALHPATLSGTQDASAGDDGEGQESRDAFEEKRRSDLSHLPRRP